LRLDDDLDDMGNPKPKGQLVWNLMTGLVIFAMLGIGVVFLLIYLDPYSELNPFPPSPSTAIVQIVIPPSTVTTEPSQTTPAKTTQLIDIPATDTSTPTLALPTETPTQTSVPQTPSPTIKSDKPFILQGKVQLVDGVLFNSAHGCNWMGVAGRIVDIQNVPISVGMIIQLRGMLLDKPINLIGLSGTFKEYGESGFEFTLADAPVATWQSLSIQLLDQAGLPLSDEIFFNTSANCQENLILINFKQVR